MSAEVRKPFEAFEEEREDLPKPVAVQSTKHRRRKICLVLSITIAIIFLTAAIAVPLLLISDDPNTGIKPNSSDSRTFDPSEEPATTSDEPTTLTITEQSESWSAWTSCSASCGNGTKRRSRVCPTNSPQYSNCSLNIEQLPCSLTPCIEPASWGQWGQWSKCSVTCANGTQLRSRNCTGEGGGNETKCEGSDQDMRKCSKPVCTKQSESWSAWTSCSVTCGNGTKRRSRVCPTNSPQYSNCSLNIEQLPCSLTPCIEPASWGQWGQWSKCSVTCANGTQLRSRNCTGGGGGNETKCEGSDQDMRKCSKPVCTKRDCLEWFMSGENNRSDGVYNVDPDDRGPFQVFCDMTTDGGGWTVFQRRQDGSEDFYRNWEDYKTGFGSLNGEFWLGNDKIHRLTARVLTKLSIDLEGWSGGLKNATYERFRIENETLNYTLTVGSYSGNAGDSFTQQNRMKFTTKDRDNDREGASNCAVGYQGGWWFKACLPSNLNGKYVGNTQDRKGLIWLAMSTNAFNSLKYTQMRIRQNN